MAEQTVYDVSDASDASDSPVSESFSEGSDDDGMDMEEEKFTKELRDFLDDIEHDGSFFSFQSSKAYVNPGLYIPNYGSIGLPLPERDAQSIARVCKQAPFGKGDETVIDTSVRNTWELDSTEFQCQNPAWAGYVTTLLDHVVKDLGVGIKCRAEPYKLLLYEEGAFFKAHRDSEKVPGMFGTLVICLPSKHTGGEVHLSHGKEKRLLETAPNSSFDISSLAWYSDVEHEVRQVKSGHRLVLTYNLVQDQSLPRQAASLLDASHSSFNRLLRIWNQEFTWREVLVYPLGHQYTEASLCLDSLKGSDAAKGQICQQLCPKNDFYLFLGRITKDEANDEYGDEEEVDYSLNNIVTTAGTPIRMDITLEKSDILAPDNYYEYRDADSEDEGEYTGNASMPARYRYHDTVCTPPLSWKKSSRTTRPSLLCVKIAFKAKSPRPSGKTLLP